MIVVCTLHILTISPVTLELDISGLTRNAVTLFLMKCYENISNVLDLISHSETFKRKILCHGYCLKHDESKEINYSTDGLY